MSHPVTADDSWKTPELREAEAALDRTVRKSQQLLKDLEKIKLRPLPKTDTPERIEAIKRAASRPDAPAQLRLIKRKVDAGEYSWEDVAAGRAFADPEVRALADEKLSEAKDILEELEEGQRPEEILEARTGGAGNPLSDTGRSKYPDMPDKPAGFSAADPLAGSVRPQPPAPPAPEPAEYSNDNPLADRTPPPPAPPKEEPPAPPRHRAPEPEPEDDFADPLADRGGLPKRSDPQPPPSSGRRSRRQGSGDDDDYFGGSFLS
ncbi:hypothetical protein [Amycolatopsis rubida]|uniref:Uncharacterized protein n=1 Tax=Amycolatopsis rubida TaxID=112413 RepID=A0A1I5YHG0_9PSEU|nr:hypothetical protein [Amycolatopsis rubida]SFQ43652.1 hypothetical protein SAMN05421854_11296 [Amycolatopsis rubida]